MDKINIVISKAVLEVPSFTADTRSKSSSVLVIKIVKSQLFKTAPYINEPLFYLD